MIIGITGRIGAGKDELAKAIASLWPQFETRKFSAKLKHVAAILCGVDASDFEDQVFKSSEMGPQWSAPCHLIGIPGQVNISMTYRAFLQKLGTEAVRNGLHPEAWVNALMADYQPSMYWAVTDVRFQNEANAVTNAGGICVRVIRPDNPYPVSSHISETALDGVEMMNIINNGSIEELKQQAQKLLGPILDRFCPSGAGIPKYLPDSP